MGGDKQETTGCFELLTRCCSRLQELRKPAADDDEDDDDAPSDTQQETPSQVTNQLSGGSAGKTPGGARFLSETPEGPFMF